MEYPFCRTNMEKISCTNWKLCSSWIYMDLPHSGGRFYQFIDRLSLRPLLDSMAAPLIISELIYGHWVAELNIHILALFFHALTLNRHPALGCKLGVFRSNPKKYSTIVPCNSIQFSIGLSKLSKQSRQRSSLDSPNPAETLGPGTQEKDEDPIARHQQVADSALRPITS